MILHFPDLHTLRLALTSGVVPTDLSTAPAQVGFEEQGLWLEPSVAVPRAVYAELRPLGVREVKRGDVAPGESVCCWPQILPVERGGDTAPTDQTPVLFDLPCAAQLADLVSEILRLGNDRQGYRWLQADDGSGRALLRVVGPPYYALLRALDPAGPKDQAPVAYVERAPRVWVEIGYRHPLVEHIAPPADKMLLLRPPRQWTFLKEQPFRDIYEILEFPLPDAIVHAHDADLGQRLRVPLRLARGGPIHAAELWVVRDNALEQLDTLVRGATDHLLARLAVAVTEQAGRPTIILRVRPSKQPPPVLVLQAEGFRSYLRLANLFLPCGTRLQPPLRRDVVRRLLAEDAGRITWLTPHADGSFTPESVPDDAFRPLADWVDYVLEHEHQALDAWVQATRFDFEPFICKDDRPDEPRKKRAAREPAEKQEGWKDWFSNLFGGTPAGEPPAGETTEGEAAPGDVPAEQTVHEEWAEPLAVEPPLLEKHLRELEERFLALDGPDEAAERQKLWPELAGLNGKLHNTTDATVCWVNALWEPDPSPLWAFGWLRAEAKGVERYVTAHYLDRLLSEPEPEPGDARALAACLMWAVVSDPSAAAPSNDAQYERAQAQHAAVMERLGPIQFYLETHEKWLPVRAAWLAWFSLVRLTGGDVLALARARDRLLERLYQDGLRADLDLPSFLRFTGPGGNAHARGLRDRVLRLRDLAQRWIVRNTLADIDAEPTLTGAYADLSFAFGLACVGEPSASRDLLNQARAVLAPLDDVHNFLLQAYDYRIQQALDGRPHTGPLPPEQMEYLEHMDAESTMTRYKVDRLRGSSRILEPQEKVDPYRGAVRRRFHAAGDKLGQALLALPDIIDRADLAEQLGRLLRQTDERSKEKTDRARVLVAALELAPRVGERFALEVLERVPTTLDGLPAALAHTTPLERVLAQTELLERALFVGAHFGQGERVQALVSRFEELLRAEGSGNVLQAFDSLAGQCFHGLRKLGMRDEINRLLGQIAEVVLEGRSLADLRERLRDGRRPGAGLSAATWPALLRTLLHLAAGWYYFGKNKQADVLVAETWGVLLEKCLPAQEQTRLACTYAATLGQAPIEPALKRMEEMFAKLEGVRYTLTSNSHYVQPLLMVVEAVVLAVARDDFSVGSGVRRWLDEDEYHVRRRIHGDVRALMAQAGLT
jgi:hypothetical protein